VRAEAFVQEALRIDHHLVKPAEFEKLRELLSSVAP
jgi:hypothetical protein